MTRCRYGSAVQLLAVLSLLVVLSGCSLYTVRPIHGAQSSESAQNFDATKWADSIWNSKVIPTVQAQALPISTVLTALRRNPRQAEQTYGHSENSGPYNFMVKGSGTVVHVDTASLQGTADVLLAPPDSGTHVQITIGPVILGTTLRDGMKFIHFGQFLNQIQYADAATALNAKVRTSVLNHVTASSLKGKKLSFIGVFSYTGLHNIVVVPVQLAVGR